MVKAINSGLVDSYGGIIATGKEAVVIHATGGTELGDGTGQNPNTTAEIPAEMAVKVFKTTLNEFKNRQEYIGTLIHSIKYSGNQKIYLEKFYFSGGLPVPGAIPKNEPT